MLNRYFKLDPKNIDFLYANISVKNIYFALISLDYILNRPFKDYGIYHNEHTYYFFHLQSLLTACGNICNVFYNMSRSKKKKVTERCKRLCKEFNICKCDFPLIFQKEARNTNEHFDERYEQYNGQLGDYNIIGNETDSFIRIAIETNPHLRTYYKETGIYITSNRKLERIEYNLYDLQKELIEMLNRITKNPIFDSAWADSMPGEELK